MLEKKINILLFAFLNLFYLQSCGQNNNNRLTNKNNIPKMDSTLNTNDTTAQIVLGGGCFWCVEAQYLLLDGVTKVESGFAGGTLKNPTYKDVCTGLTNHAEVVRITYNPQKISFDEILYAFWQTHDPTTLNRQGNDVGTQYRSVIFYTTPQQKEIAENYKNKLNTEHAFDKPYRN